MKKFNFLARKTALKLLIIDIFIVSFSYFFSYFLRFDGNIPEIEAMFLRNSLPMVLLLKIYFIYYFELYRADLKYISINEIINLFKAIVVSSLGILFVIWLSGLTHKLPRSVLIIDAVQCFLGIGAVRAFPRIQEYGLKYGFKDYLHHIFSTSSRSADTKLKPVLIYGAGDAGEMLVREIKHSPHSEYKLVGFIDDNVDKIGKMIHGVPIIGGAGDLKKIIPAHNVEEIVICIPSLRGKLLKDFLIKCNDLEIKTKITPSLREIMDEKVSVSNIRSINVEDLLGRDPLDLNIESISDYLKNKKILITGAGGSIGSELCRQVMKFDPSLLVLFGRGEHSIYSIHNELKGMYPQSNFPQIIGDVINLSKVEKIFDTYRPDIVFHAGADKHVPLMEMNPDEAVLNNIIGTNNVIKASDKYNVERLICISTDKAVAPTSVMGACKRVAEKLIQARKTGNTKVMAVRFGNVLGSRGSVIPLFEKQIKAGGPVTVTHKDMTRYLMTIPEAAQLVIQAGAIGNNSELFVLDMGEPINIAEFARTMIRLAGYKPDKEIDILYTGVRPGEKMYEELVCADERQGKTTHPKIFKISNMHVNNSDIADEKIEELKNLSVRMDYEAIYQLLSEIVPNYRADFEKIHNTKTISAAK